LLNIKPLISRFDLLSKSRADPQGAKNASRLVNQPEGLSWHEPGLQPQAGWLVSGLVFGLLTTSKHWQSAKRVTSHEKYEFKTLPHPKFVTFLPGRLAPLPLIALLFSMRSPGNSV